MNVLFYFLISGLMWLIIFSFFNDKKKQLVKKIKKEKEVVRQGRYCNYR